MRAIVCGSRDLTDADYVFRSLDVLRETMGLSHVIEGGQRRYNGWVEYEPDGGADYWAMRWAKARGLTWDTVDAEWTKLGKAAGPIRNAKMLAQYAPDVVIAFPGGSGTSDMIRRAERARINVISIRPNGRLTESGGTEQKNSRDP
jgi:hypothetical protein